MNIDPITNFQDLRKWKEGQATYVKDRWGTATKEFVEDGLNQIRLVSLPNFYPFVIVSQWIGTANGPFLQVAAITMNHFPTQNDRLHYLDSLIVKTKMNLIDLANSL
jgi:hypothetical protein